MTFCDERIRGGVLLLASSRKRARTIARSKIVPRLNANGSCAGLRHLARERSPEW